MTDDRVFELLLNIFNEASEEKYPELCALIAPFLDDDFVFDEPPLYIAEMIQECDESEQLPPSAWLFLQEVYGDALREGDADAACNLGALYYSGRGGEQSYSKAIEYYTIAAKSGCPQAQENLGYCYYYGRDTAVDYQQAFHYFALGAFAGSIRSLYKIGDMYRYGQYVEKNPEEAFQIYSHCAELLKEELIPVVGADLMLRLGDCFYEGIGTEADYFQALKHYQSAEQLFVDRLVEGDFLIRGSYEKSIRMQEEVRKKLSELLPSYQWTK